MRALTFLLLIVLSLALVMLFIVTAAELLLIFPPLSMQAVQNMFTERVSAPINFDFITFSAYKIKLYTFMLYHYWPLTISALLGGACAYIAAGILLQHQATKNYISRIHFLEREVKKHSRQYTNESDAHEAMLARVEALYNHSPEAYLILNDKGNVTHINPAAERFFKVLHEDKEQFLNLRIHNLLPSFAETGLARLFDQIVAKKAVWQGEIQLQDTPIWLNLKIIHAGHKGVILIFRDISHENKPENNHTNQDNSYLAQSLLTDSPQAFALLDADLNLEQCSPAFAKLLQQNKRTLKGKKLSNYLLVSRWDDVKAALKQGKQYARAEEKILLNHQEHWLEWSISPWRTQQDKLGGYFIFVNDITELHNIRNRAVTKEGEEHAMAYQDALTGLPNRQLFNDRLNMALAQAYRQLGKLAILFLDLDGFKAVNDTLGHDAGDILLKEVANRLENIVRDTDTVARLGGDEFTIILNIRETKDATIVAKKIIDAVNKPYQLGNKEANVSTSIGIALYPIHGDGAADLMKKADTAMYAAKTSGKNQFIYYSEQLNTDSD